MTYDPAENDCDSAFGDDPLLWADYMFPPVLPLAGSKRDAGSDAIVNGEPAASEAPERPPKRKATGDFHGQSHANLTSNIVPQFPDTCFETFCQGCDWEPPSCTSPCALPCSGDECTPDDACWDPNCESSCTHTPCDQRSPSCADDCVDPECTKLSDTEDPCCCQACDAPPCPLEPECHSAHTAPTTDGTIFCYDTAPCHFQEGLHGYNPVLSGYETYPCYSQAHGITSQAYDETQASSVATPALSAGNYTSLESTLDDDLSPLPGSYAPNEAHCLLDIAGEHCHIPPQTCCHGDSRGCGDFPTAPQEDLDVWYQSIAQGNGLANSLLDFSFHHDHPTLTPSATRSTLQNPMFGGDDFSWMLPESNFCNTYSVSAPHALKLEPIAVKRDLNESGQSLPDSTSACVCKWQHDPGFLCLAIFDKAEALHKHIKTVHVDNCTQCVCQWEGCEASSKDFKQRSKLSRHLLGHAGHRPYACSFEGCNKTFATNQAKDNHERTHTGDRPYVCDRCGYTTTTYTQLQTHISALHEGKKPHKCRFCDFSCADSSNLSKHERTHQVSMIPLL
jgi:hypothetical protein